MALSIFRSNSANLIRQQWRTSIRQATTRISSLQCNTITLKRFMLSAAPISVAHPSVPSSTTAIPSPSSSQPGELDPDSPSPSSPSSPRTFTLTVDRHDRGMRFDRWLRSQLDDPQKMSQGQIQKLCRKGVIRRRVNKSSNLTLSSALDESPSLPSDRSKVDPSDRLLGGDTFILPLWMKENILTPESKVMIDPKTHCRLNEFEKMELIESILYEDEDICILNKPSGLAVHPGTSNERRNLLGMIWVLEERADRMNAEFSHHSSTSSPSPSSSRVVFRLIHRLDKETSGCVIFAKNRHTAQVLGDLLKQQSDRGKQQQQPQQQQQQQEQSQQNISVDPSKSTMAYIHKHYVALVHGCPLKPSGSLISPSPEGETCHSTYELLASSVSHSASVAPSRSPSLSLLSLHPHTGRKRQLRRHCHFELGCTIVGEKLHQISDEIKPNSEQQRVLSEKERRIQRLIGLSDRPFSLCLHADSIQIYHPTIHRGEPLTVTAPRPEQFDRIGRFLQPRANQINQTNQ